ncbi:MAG: hypothetical protein ACKPDM_11775, partial [Dolichospermum sp.]
ISLVILAVLFHETVTPIANLITPINGFSPSENSHDSDDIEKLKLSPKSIKPGKQDTQNEAN